MSATVVRKFETLHEMEAHLAPHGLASDETGWNDVRWCTGSLGVWMVKFRLAGRSFVECESQSG
jgi:hypothetical protein